jgi:hypothetical protein
MSLSFAVPSSPTSAEKVSGKRKRNHNRQKPENGKGTTTGRNPKNEIYFCPSR